MGGIVYLSGHPAPQVVHQHDFTILFLKFTHIVEYGILGLLYYFAIRRTTALPRGRAIVLTTLLAGLFGVTDEIHQIFTPGRGASPWDVGTDTIAGFLGALFLKFL